MNYRVLCDENVDRAAITALEDRGIDAVHVLDRPGQSSPDEEVAATARREDRLLLTNDEDFLDRSRFPDVRILYFDDNRVAGSELAGRVDSLREYVHDQTDLSRVTYLTKSNVDR